MSVVNPFHTVQHPGSKDELPPLPPHVEEVSKHQVMQQPPPSPPLTEPDEYTNEPEAYEEPLEPLEPPVATRRVSNGSSRAGSLAIVRSGRLAPPREVPQRRLTNPTPPSPLIPLQKSHSTLTPVPGIDGAALDSDIIAQAEAIRRERLERRQKKAAEVKEKEVLVGNLIGEDHVNYVLMYNMLTGIRIGVSLI